MTFRDIEKSNPGEAASTVNPQEASEASQFIESFMACVGEDRLARVVDPEPARRALLGRWSRRGPQKPIRLSNGALRSFEGPKGSIVKRTVVVAELRAPLGNIGPMTYVLAKTKSGYKVNATETYGLGEMSFLEFVEKRPTHPVLFRVEATLANYYNYEFGAEGFGRFGREVRNKFYSVELDNPDEGFGGLTYGYLDKGNPTAKALFELLKDGQKHQITVMLATYPWLTKAPDKICVIESMVAPSWASGD
jgi:hypothetical protein